MKPAKIADDGFPNKKPCKRRSLKLSASERAAVPAIIEPYRYVAESDREWQTATLSLQPFWVIHVASHSEMKGHTYYHFDCSLSMSSKLAPYLTWSGKRRLHHLRKGLHDISKRELGSLYKTHFKDVPFAHRGGVRGTTKRLDKWCCRLAECINSRIVPPVVVAQALKLLDASVPSLPCEELQLNKMTPSACDSCASASTTDVENTEGVLSDCTSYESDFESDSECDVVDSESDSIAEDLPDSVDDLAEEDIPIAPCEPSCDMQAIMQHATMSELSKGYTQNASQDDCCPGDTPNAPCPPSADLQGSAQGDSQEVSGSAVVPTAPYEPSPDLQGSRQNDSQYESDNSVVPIAPCESSADLQSSLQNSSQEAGDDAVVSIAPCEQKADPQGSLQNSRQQIGDDGVLITPPCESRADLQVSRQNSSQSPREDVVVPIPPSESESTAELQGSLQNSSHKPREDVDVPIPPCLPRAELQGSLRNSSQEPGDDAVVLIHPCEPRADLQGSAQSDSEDESDSGISI